MESLLSVVLQGWDLIFNLETLFWMILGTLLGMIVGIIPGLSSGMALAILLPLTFGIEPINGLVFLFSAYVSVTYGGSLTAIVMNTPGAPESAPTAFEGYPLTLKGQSGQAIGTAIFSSFLGGTLSYILLLFTITILGIAASYFGPSELFLIAMIGVLILGAMGTGSPIKTFISGFLGLLIGTIGMAPTGEYLATFGSIHLADGIQIVPAMVGVFVLSELLFFIGRDYVVDDIKSERKGANIKDLVEGFKYPFIHTGTLMRSILLGKGIGIIPAAGATMAAFASYALAKRTSKNPQLYGKGAYEGIVAAETANNACSAGAIMTTLILGVPGSVATAVMLGALTIHGLQVGPQFIYQQGPLVYGLILAAIISQFFMIAVAGGAGLSFSKVLNLKVRFLVPILVIFAIIGSFAIRNSVFDIFIMIGFGTLGYFLKIYHYSPAALILGLILSPIANNELTRAIQIHGSNTIQAFFTRPLSIAILLIIAWTIYRSFFGRRNDNERVENEA